MSVPAAFRAPLHSHHQFCLHFRFCLVVSVYRERTLQTVTNWFIVSLAFADLFVTMPMLFSLYVMVRCCVLGSSEYSTGLVVVVVVVDQIDNFPKL